MATTASRETRYPMAAPNSSLSTIISANSNARHDERGHGDVYLRYPWPQDQPIPTVRQRNPLQLLPERAELRPASQCGRSAGNATWYEYNGRGERTKLTHQDGSYVQSSYNRMHPAWTADENHPGAANDPNQRTRLYLRRIQAVLTVTNPLNRDCHQQLRALERHRQLFPTRPPPFTAPLRPWER